MAETALRTAEVLHLKLEQDRRLIASLIEAAETKDETPRRFLTLVAASAACALLVIFSASLVPAAFTTPPPNYGVAGVASIYVWANPLNSEQASSLRNPGISLSVAADQRDSSVEYVATFPRELVGDRFVLATSGAGVLSELKSNASEVSVEYPECRTFRDGANATPATCQLITGIVPSLSSDASPGCRSEDVAPMVSVRFSGSAELNSAFDWAHHITSLPYLGHSDGLGSGNMDGIVEGTYGQNFPDANLTTCYRLGLNPQWMDPTPNFEPNIFMGDFMNWDPASNGASYVVVSTERSAQWRGNALLAVLGVFGPVLLSLVALTLRSGSRLRSQSRRRAS